MISSSREKSFQAKQEGHNNNDGNSTSSFKASSSTTTTSSRQWSGFRNPRIVRVSRTFGGKDRHSKVSTVRGLRDRRIRLSVPTAVQLYDLQDRLGLSQPSKVIDWLLDATEHDIDKLPPLQVPHGFGHQFHQQHMLNPQSNNSLAAPFFDVNSTFMQNIEADHQAELLLHDHQHQRSSTTSNVRVLGDQKGKSIKTNADEQDHDGQNRDHQQDGNNVGGQLLAQKLFPMGNYPSSIPGLLNNGMAYNYVHNYSEPSSLSLSQFGSHGFTPQIDHHMMSNALPFSSSMPTGSHQLFFCPSTATPSLFAPYPSYITNPVVESSSTTYTNEPRTSQANSHFQFLSSSSSQNFLHNAFVPSLHSVSSSLRSFPTLVNPKQLHSNSQHNNGSQRNKDAP